MTDQPVQKRFTGRHAAMILVAFFGVVIAVNIVMASFALSTFGGTVVDNSYVASQHYNQWLARADAQRSEEHTSELQSLMRISYAVFCLKKKNRHIKQHNKTPNYTLNHKTSN